MNEPDKQSDNISNKTKPPGRRKGIYLVAFFLFALILLSRHEPINTIDCTPDIIASKPDVIMLGAWWCTYCYQTKRFLQQNNIHYCEYDMENTTIGKRLYQEHGGGAIPILLIGKYQINGYSEQQIEAALKLLKQ